MRLRITVGLFVIFTFPAFIGGMLYCQWLLAVKPAAPVPVMLLERPAPPDGYDYPIPQNMVTAFFRWSDITGVPAWVLARTSSWESGFNANWNRDHHLRNENGSYDEGCMGLNSYTQLWFAVKYNGGEPVDPFDVETAVRIAALWMHDLYEQFGDWRLVVGAWNAGPGTPPQAWKPITVRHVKAILGGDK